ncbi:MAG: PIN domain-containing protein [Spirochaetales bacterium]|nr:PIN domain-containing protein [Spirochaetales bacterium]
METRLYLDTHIVVWLYDSEIKKLSKKACQLIDSGLLYVSEFVRLELQYLYEIKRIEKEPDTIICYLEDEIGLKRCDHKLSGIITESFLHDWTRDPFDRLITANASFMDDNLLTKDEKILKNYKNAIW